MTHSLKPGFGKRLREERIRLGLSQQEFAERAGIKRASQYLYEKEEGVPNLRYLMAIAELGIDLHFLLFEQVTRENLLQLTPFNLKEIYRTVDEIARDGKGQLLPLETRAQFFSLLCSAYSGREDEPIDTELVKTMLAS